VAAGGGHRKNASGVPLPRRPKAHRAAKRGDARQPAAALTDATAAGRPSAHPPPCRFTPPRSGDSGRGHLPGYPDRRESGSQLVGAAELHFIARVCGATGAELLGRAIQATDK
jgi:hypothetical protein